MTFAVGDIVEVTLGGWSGDRIGSIVAPITVPVDDIHYIRVNIPANGIFHDRTYLLTSNEIRFISRPNSMDHGAQEFGDYHAAQAIMDSLGGLA
jgi:hypothetical protein